MERFVPIFFIVSRPSCHAVAVCNITAGPTEEDHSALLSTHLFFMYGTSKV